MHSFHAGEFNLWHLDRLAKVTNLLTLPAFASWKLLQWCQTYVLMAGYSSYRACTWFVSNWLSLLWADVFIALQLTFA